MSVKDVSPDTNSMPHQLFRGTTWHSRLLPNVNKFAYPYRYWGVNISALAAGQALPEVVLPTIDKSVEKKDSLKSKSLRSRLLNSSRSFAIDKLKGLPLFSAQHKAVQQFCANDYLQDSDNAKDKSNEYNTEQDSFANNQLLTRLSDIFIEQTGSAPIGDMMGLLVCRNAGLYFSPVNFYLGFDGEQLPTHLLAEVSNTPWDKRHYYGFLLDGVDSEFCHDKDFHVSPFNPIDQLYSWQVKVERQQEPNLQDRTQNCLNIRIAINISDVRGEVLKTGIKMTGIPMTAATIRTSLRKNPLMNVTSLTRIYWHAFKLYAIKKVPYVGYDEKLADSGQS